MAGLRSRSLPFNGKERSLSAACPYHDAKKDKALE